jgi:pimeloyl-ACP methyl ester carboxylesterase
MRLIAVIVVSCCTANLIAQQIGHSTVTFTDASRGNRQIQTEVYYPATTAGNNTPILQGVFPLVVCGHGFVMTWSAYENIWTTLVPEGYIVAFPTTEGGISPVHSDFGMDLKYLVSAMQGGGAGASVPASSVGPKSAIMGHSMGGGASFIAAANNPGITTMVSFAAANTNPSSVSAAQQVTVPTLLFSGTNDCVTPPAQQQDIIYDSTAAAFKTQVYITGGGHCYFADYNFNCAFGEATCSPSPTITRAEQQSTTSAFLKLWLAYFLKGDCGKAQEFQDSLVSSPGISYRQSQSIACPTGIVDGLSTEVSITVFPNPSFGIFTVRSNKGDIMLVQVYSLEGSRLRHYIFSNGSAQQTIDISTLGEGVYLLLINDQQFRIVLSR